MRTIAHQASFPIARKSHVGSTFALICFIRSPCTISAVLSPQARAAAEDGNSITALLVIERDIPLARQGSEAQEKASFHYVRNDDG